MVWDYDHAACSADVGYFVFSFRVVWVKCVRNWVVGNCVTVT